MVVNKLYLGAPIKYRLPEIENGLGWIWGIQSLFYFTYSTLYHPHLHLASLYFFNFMAGKTQLERAIKQIQGRGPAPDIDFTQHQLENGYTVSTQERVVKEVLSPLTSAPFLLFLTFICPMRARRECNYRSKPRL
jgi:hypothetical protein